MKRTLLSEGSLLPYPFCFPGKWNELKILKILRYSFSFLSSPILFWKIRPKTKVKGGKNLLFVRIRKFCDYVTVFLFEKRWDGESFMKNGSLGIRNPEGLSIYSLFLSISLSPSPSSLPSLWSDLMHKPFARLSQAFIY